MKYSVVKAVNSNYAIVSEHSDLQSAIVKYHDTCKIHWNAPDVLDATIGIFDENLDNVVGYKEHIHHEPQPQEEVDVEVESEGE